MAKRKFDDRIGKATAVVSLFGMAVTAALSLYDLYARIRKRQPQQEQAKEESHEESTRPPLRATEQPRPRSIGPLERQAQEGRDAADQGTPPPTAPSTVSTMMKNALLLLTILGFFIVGYMLVKAFK